MRQMLNIMNDETIFVIVGYLLILVLPEVPISSFDIRSAGTVADIFFEAFLEVKIKRNHVHLGANALYMICKAII